MRSFYLKCYKLNIEIQLLNTHCYNPPFSVILIKSLGFMNPPIGLLFESQAQQQSWDHKIHT